MKRSPKGPSFVPAIRLRRFCVIFLLCICLAQVIRAQDPAPSAQPTETQSQSPKDAAQNPTTSSTTETKDKEKSAKAEEKKKEEEKKAHRGSIVVAPLPIVSPAIGSGIVPVVGYIFPLQVNKEHPEPSVIGAAGLATNNGTRGFGLGGDVYLKEARYEIKAVYVHGNIDYNLYGVGYANGNAGLKLPLVQTGEVFSSSSCAISVGTFTWGGGSLLAIPLLRSSPRKESLYRPSRRMSSCRQICGRLAWKWCATRGRTVFIRSREAWWTSRGIFSRTAWAANTRFSPTNSRSISTQA